MGFQSSQSDQKVTLNYIFESEDSVNKNALEMMINNEIPGLVRAIYSRKNNDRVLKYAVGEYVTLSAYASQIYLKNNVHSIIFSMMEAIQNAYEYMIDAKYLVFDMEKIFYDRSHSRVMMVCVPVECDDATASFARLVQKLARDNNGTRDVYISELIAVINANAGSAPAAFWKGVRQVHRRFAMTEGQRDTADFAQNRRMSPMGGADNAPSFFGDSSGMRDVPPQFGAQNDAVPGMNPEDDGEEPISWLYLMQHYNAENAQKYREQKKKGKTHTGSVGADKATPENTPFLLPGQEDTSGQTTKMSLFYLLQHYNADNARIYREQKGKQNASAPKNNPSGSSGTGVSYAIPGVKQTLPGFGDELPRPAAPKETAPIQRVHANFGGTVMVPEEEQVEYGFETPLELSDVHARRLMLVRQKTNERAEITKSEFVVGRSQSKSDFVIDNSPAIGRSHAKLVTRGDQCYLVDLGSLNKTYLNGRAIEPNEENLLSHGDQIRMADEEFLFLEE